MLDLIISKCIILAKVLQQNISQTFKIVLEYPPYFFCQIHIRPAAAEAPPYSGAAPAAEALLPPA